MRSSVIAVLSLFVGLSLETPLSTTSTTTPTTTQPPAKNESLLLESVYHLTARLTDGHTESTLSMKLRCQPRSEETLACRLYEPEYETVHRKPPCENASLCTTDPKFLSDGLAAYVGNFDVKHRKSEILGVVLSRDATRKQMTLYRRIANHLFSGMDVEGKPDGTYTLPQVTPRGKCMLEVKIVRTRTKKSPLSDGTPGGYDHMLSVKKTRNLELCTFPPSILIFIDYLYHPVMSTGWRYDVRSSISRVIKSEGMFTSYISEDVAVSTECRENTAMLHFRTTLILLSREPAKDPMPLIPDPKDVEPGYY